ncbi:FGGY-family carbohydrate kinase [Nakamurella leprariae]|uniref:Carbohydrate kinase FGGY C-terminal domain-containing protein n=1 Tax=Nakamurella leprariae TaxID=2803911 RepID=A0A939BWS4_9ACTN|nr:FGGY-family carbohydrate kinase [Nakamurella leprariae]MBM9467843.1 hypothetical protein [Nakamurella leprariae]
MDALGVLHAVETLLDACDLEGVQVVASSVLWQSLLPVDNGGAPLDAVTTWEAAHPERVRHRLLDRVPGYDPTVTGVPLHPSSPTAAIAALHDRPLADAPARLTDLGGWVLGRLTGADTGWSEAIAAGSGLWDQAARTWAGPVLDGLGVAPEQFGPRFAAPVTMTPARARRWPALRTARWLPPLGDGLCHNLGQSVVGADAVAVTVATSGSVRRVEQTATYRPPVHGLWAYRCDARTVVRGAAVTSAGNTLEWLARFVGRPLDWSFAAGPPRLPDLVTDPSVFGRRSPDYPWEAAGSVGSLRPHHTLDDVGTAMAIDLLAQFGPLLDLVDPDRGGSVWAAGGVLDHAPVAAQLLADTIGRDVSISPQTEASLHGAARLGQAWLRRSERIDVDGLVDDAVTLAAAGTRLPPVAVRQPRPLWTRALAARARLTRSSVG